MNLEENVLSHLSDKEDELATLAKDIWHHPQIALQESYASGLISSQLERAGFSVRRELAHMPTAFLGSWGEGTPIIGVFGEYDALPGLSQKISASREPTEEAGPGHGCGHNLLGVASLAAALTVKAVMEDHGIKGTIRYYGCPAEETLVGKVFMARDGLFDDLQAALTWHPMYANTVWNSASTAMNSFKFNFHGVSTHAAVSPEAGRSALDAVILTDIGVNYLREHIIQDARIHCVITNGGLAPNVVPSYAQVWYYVRAPQRSQVDEIYQRVLNIAKGASLMTGTTFDVQFLVGCYDYMPNETIGQTLLEKMKEVGAPQFTDDEIAFAKLLQTTVSHDAVEGMLRSYGLTREQVGDPLCDKILDKVGSWTKGDMVPGSTDVGDLSHIAPTAQVTTCCMPLGIPVHSWQSTASVGSTIGLKGMILAAKTLALTALDLLTKPQLVEAAHDEFEKATGGKKYVSPLPQGAVPSIE